MATTRPRGRQLLLEDLNHVLDHQERLLASPQATDSLRRDTASKILDTMTAFLTQWRATSDNGHHDNDEFPSGRLRRACSTLLSHLGPGDAQVRNWILQQLTATAGSSSRQVLLDVLPWAMPLIRNNSRKSTINENSTSHNSVPVQQKRELQVLEQVTTQVIDTLQAVLKSDPAALLPVVGCLSSLPLSEEGQAEAFHVALTSLALVSESELPTLITTLLRHVSCRQDAVRALEALRAEVAMVVQEQSANGQTVTDDPMTMILHVVLRGLFQDDDEYGGSDGKEGSNGRDKQHVIAHAYFEILQRLVGRLLDPATLTENFTDATDPSSTMLVDGDDTNSAGTDGYCHQFLAMDLAVLLALYQHAAFVDVLEQLLDSLVLENTFPFDTLQDLVTLMCGDRNWGRPTSILYQRLIPALLSFGIFLYLTPLRSQCKSVNLSRHHNNLHVTAILLHTQRFILHLHHHVDREYQVELVHCLLNLSEESTTARWMIQTEASSRKRQYSQSARELTWLSSPEHESPCDDGDSDRPWFQRVVNKAVNSTLQELATSNPGSFASFKHILMGRLTTSSSVFATTCWERQSIQQLCAILSSLFEPAIASTNSRHGSAGLHASEIMIILQKLLFSSSYATFSSASRSSKASILDNGRVIRGMLLATELIKSPFLSSHDWDCAKQWVLRILLPTTRRMVDPEVGSPGLDFLEALTAKPADHNTNNHQRTTFTGLHSGIQDEVFQNIKMVLANTGLIQMLARYQQQHLGKSHGTVVKLGYTAKPSLPFLVDAVSTKKRKVREMVFCVAFFLRNSDLCSPNRWNHTVQWVFHLVDTYLRIGRDISLQASTNPKPSNPARTKASENGNWTPHGWMQAAIELPLLPLRQQEPDSVGKSNAHSWIQAQFCRYELEFDEVAFSDQENCQGRFVDLLCGEESAGELQKVVLSAQRLGLALLLSISLSCAVIKNCYAHFQSLVASRRNHCSTQEEAEVLRLVQFQLLKIYDMKKRCECVEYLLSALKLHARRMGVKLKRSQPEVVSNEGGGTLESGCTEGPKRQSKDECAKVARTEEEIEDGISQMKKMLSMLFGSGRFFSPDLLLKCVIDGDHDKQLREAMDAVAQSPSCSTTTQSLKLHLLIKLKRCLLDHVIDILIQGPGEDNYSYGAPMVSVEAEFALEMGIYLTGITPKIRKTDVNCEATMLTEAAAELASSNFRLVLVVLARLTDLVPSAQRSQSPKASVSLTDGQALDRTPFHEYISNCLNVFQCKYKLPRDPADSRIGAVNTTYKAFQGFLIILKGCDDGATAMILLEILSVLASHVQKADLNRELASANWKALHTIYATSPDGGAITELPYLFIAILRRCRVFKGLGISPCGRSLCDKLMRGFAKGKQLKENNLLRQCLLRHWGLLIGDTRLFEVCSDHVSRVVDDLSTLLGSMDVSVSHTTQQEEKKEDGHELRREKKTHVSIHAGRHGSQTSQPTAVPGIASLNASSFPGTFELLLNMTVYSMSTLLVGVSQYHSCSGDKKSIGTIETGPYWRIKHVLVLYSNLLDLFEKYIHLFPRRTISTMFMAGKQMLNATVMQLRNCVEWRNSQPLLSVVDKAKGRYDPGAMGYLQSLLDACCSNAAGRVVAYCDFIESQQSHSEPQHDSDVDYQETVDGVDKALVNRSIVQKAKTLRSHVQKEAQTFREVARSHNLMPPEIGSDDSTLVRGLEVISAGKRKLRTEEDKGFHQLDPKSAVWLSSRSLKRKASTRRRPYVREESSASEAEDDDHSSFRPSPYTHLRIRDEDDVDVDEVDDENMGSDQYASFAVDDEDDYERGADSSSESFGAKGDWGDDNMSKASTEGSLGLEAESSLFND